MNPRRPGEAGRGVRDFDTVPLPAVRQRQRPPADDTAVFEVIDPTEVFDRTAPGDDSPEETAVLRGAAAPDITAVFGPPVTQEAAEADPPTDENAPIRDVEGDEHSGSSGRDGSVGGGSVGDGSVEAGAVKGDVPQEGAVREGAVREGADGDHDQYDDEYDEEPPMRSRRRGPLLVLGVFAAIIFGGGYLLYRSFFGAPDYEGAGRGDVIVQVEDGDTISAIGAALVKSDVVRSSKSFVQAAEEESRARSVQPGYYRMRQRMSGEAAVKLLLDPKTRVGQLEIKGGVQLDDTRGPDGTVAPGVLSKIAQATCTQVNGSSTCVSVGQLRETMGRAPLESLGVPDWARNEIGRAEPNRRLEGFVAPGRYDVRPGSSAEEVWRALVSRSATQYEASGLRPGAGTGRYTPYQLLVVASLVEKEGTTGDFDKVAGVIYNRLSTRMRLELDSTVNYPLDLQAVRTNASDRGRAGPYNSYANYGLPPTPIGAPGSKAIEAALRPAAGPFMFFVKCHTDGTSCFSTTLPEHLSNVRAAQAAGVY